MTAISKVVAGFASGLLATTVLAAQTAPPPVTHLSADPPQVTEHEDGIATSVSAPGPHVAQVRIVRLSQVMGHVQMDRNNPNGFEATFPNLPIIEGAKLKTEEGFAEAEFEDNSSLRLAPDSQVDFERLGRDASGATINRMNLVRGTLYLSLANTKADTYFLRAGDAKIELTPSSHIRVDIYPAGSQMKVFKGSATMTDSHGAYLLTKGKVLDFGSAKSGQPVIARNEEPGLYDNWDKQSADYHSMRMNVSSFAGSPYQYGLNDMSYYGGVSNLAGCGQVWQPYFASAGWSPYASGMWAYYPSTGYSWVSPYPWGWTPFHSGEWVSCGGAGWGWRPGGGGWNGLNNVNSSAIAGKTPIGKPIPHRPGEPRPLMVLVGAGLLKAPSAKAGSEKYTFASGSAGIGIPRQAFGNLGKISERVAVHGTSEARLQADAAILVPRAASANPASTPRSTSMARVGSPVGVGRIAVASRPVATASNSGGGFGHSSAGSGGYAGSTASSGSSHASISSVSASSSAGATSSGASGGSHK